MKAHDARINADHYHNGPLLHESSGFLTRLLATQPAWASIGIKTIVDSLESQSLQAVPNDINGQPHALHAWLSSCPSRMIQVLHDSWFQPLRNIASNASEADVDRLESTLEQLGCDPLARDANGVDCVDLACIHGRYNSLRRWHNAGLDLGLDSRRIFLPSAAAGQWFAPVHLASMAGSVEQLQVLVASGADLNAPDSEDKTALFHAKDARTAEWLLENGADASIVDHSGIDARIHWQSGIWPSQKIDQMVACLSGARSSLAGPQAIPAFVTLSYKQPPTRLKAEVARLKVGLDATHEGHGLIGHAALRVMEHAGTPGPAATRWLEWLLERKLARASVNDIDLGLLCLIHRIGPDLTQDDPDITPAAARVLDLARNSNRTVAEHIGLAMDQYPQTVAVQLMRKAHYLERFMGDDDQSSCTLVDRSIAYLAKECHDKPPLSLAWLSEQVQNHPHHEVWKTPHALEAALILGGAAADGLAWGVSTKKASGQLHQAFSHMVQHGARAGKEPDLWECISQCARKLARNDDERFEQIEDSLLAAYDAGVMSDTTPQARPSRNKSRF